MHLALAIVAAVTAADPDVRVVWTRDDAGLTKTVLVGGVVHRATTASVPDCTVWFDLVGPTTINLYSGSPAPGSPNEARGPDGWQAPLSPPVVVPGPVGPASPAGWSDAGTTVGNNAIQGSFHWTGVGQITEFPQVDLTTLHAYDPGLHSTESYEAIGAHAFAIVNLAHDWFWHAGFQEADGAAQQSNFGRGGVEGDPVYVEVMHNERSPKYIVGCACNPTDGESPALLFWNFFNDLLWPDRHSVLATSIVVHEYAHIVTTRLVGAPVNPDGTDNVQGRALSEGFSDVLALLWDARPADDPSHAHTIGAWPALHFFGNGEFFDNYWFGVRTYPYSTDLAINPRHLGHLDQRTYPLPPDVPASPLQIIQDHDEHEVGEIAAAFLWDIWAGMRQRYPFNDARSRMTRTIVLAQKLMPILPDFADLRDAVLEADALLNEGENWVPIWLAAAKRGLGDGAVVPPSDQLVPVVPSFEPIDFGDWNRDGVSDILDALAFHADLIGGTLRADINLDQHADVVDLVVWVETYGN